MKSVGNEPVARRRRRPWLIALPVGILAALGLAWTAFWFQAASTTRTVLVGWQEREASLGRTYKCDEQSVGGFPFRFSLRCDAPQVTFSRTTPPTVFSARDAVVTAQVWQPDLIVGELAGPLEIADVADNAALTVSWTLAQASLHGLPTSPERAAFVLDRPSVVARRADTSAQTLLGEASRAAFDARIVSGSARRDPVLELTLALDDALAPALGRAAAMPLDLDATGVLHGLKDLSPHSARETLRALQAANGRLEVTRLRMQQGDVIATGTGTLRLSPRGALDGELDVSVVNVDKLLPLLGVDRLVSRLLPQSTREKLAPQLDKLMPGLGGLLRGAGGGGGPAVDGGGSGVAAALGPSTEVEGKKAVRLPLRILDGRVMLGPFEIAELAPLY